MNEIVIDGKNATLGRLASYAAKQALLGRDVIILNCDDVLISGKKRKTIEEYRDKRKKGGANLQGPYFPKSPEKVMKRTIRGMLSYKQGRGKESLKKILCFKDIPAKYADVKKIVAGKEKKGKSIKLKDLENEI